MQIWVLPRLTSERWLGQSARFVWHVLQMALAMMVGMGLYALVLLVAGVQQKAFRAQSPELYEVTMTIAMVIPMAAWMRFRGHAWERTAEMTVAMAVPTLALALACILGWLSHDVLLGASGVLMWVAMLGAMIFRWNEYAQHRHTQPNVTRPRERDVAVGSISSADDPSRRVA